MALASTPDLARLGFGYLWAKEAFIAELNDTFDDQNLKFIPKIGVGTTTLGADKIAKPKDGFFGMTGNIPNMPKAPTLYGQYPAYLSGINSVISGGAELMGLNVINEEIGRMINIDSKAGLLSRGLKQGGSDLYSYTYNDNCW